MNDTIHGSADSRDYLFDDEVPSDLKRNEKEFTDSVSLSNVASGDNKIKENKKDNSDSQVSVKDNQVYVKDNQVSLKDMMQDL
jgi:hypothetical protein